MKKKTELIWVTQNSSPFFFVITSTFLVSFIYKKQKRSWSVRTTTENIRHKMYCVTIIFSITPDIRSSCQKAIQTDTIQLPGSGDLDQKYIAKPKDAFQRNLRNTYSLFTDQSWTVFRLCQDNLSFCLHLLQRC